MFAHGASRRILRPQGEQPKGEHSRSRAPTASKTSRCCTTLRANPSARTRALTIPEKIYGPFNFDVAGTVNNLDVVYGAQG